MQFSNEVDEEIQKADLEIEADPCNSQFLLIIFGKKG